LTEIDGLKSKWFVEDSAMRSIEENISARQKFARNYYYQQNPFRQRPCEMKNLNCDRSLMKSSLSQFSYFCPVTWRNTKTLVRCTQLPELCLFFQNVFFYFKSAAEKAIFLENPNRFTTNVIFSSAKGIPIRLKHHKAAEISAQEKATLGYCPVSLVEE
jgi:hypothetical protein